MKKILGQMKGISLLHDWFVNSIKTILAHHVVSENSILTPLFHRIEVAAI
jgi:hypothetical protein